MSDKKPRPQYGEFATPEEQRALIKAPYAYEEAVKAPPTRPAPVRLGSGGRRRIGFLAILLWVALLVSTFMFYLNIDSRTIVLDAVRGLEQDGRLKSSVDVASLAINYGLLNFALHAGAIILVILGLIWAFVRVSRSKSNLWIPIITFIFMFLWQVGVLTAGAMTALLPYLG